MHYDLTDLRVFLAVLEEGQVSRGAERCHLSPSSVSARITSLENALGTKLFDRTARGITATTAGLVLADHARRCLGNLEQMHAAMAPFGFGVTGRVTLFANTNAINSFLPDDLAPFFKEHPAVRITMEERTSSSVVAAVVDNRADIGVTALSPNNSLLDYFPYRRDTLVVLVPSDHALAKRDSTCFSDCLAYPFISLMQGASIPFFRQHASDVGGQVDIRVQISGYKSMTRLIRSGAGISIVPQSILGDNDIEGLKAVKLDEFWANRHLHVCVKKDREENFYRDALLDILIRSANAHEQQIPLEATA